MLLSPEGVRTASVGLDVYEVARLKLSSLVRGAGCIFVKDYNDTIQSGKLPSP